MIFYVSNAWSCTFLPIQSSCGSLCKVFLKTCKSFTCHYTDCLSLTLRLGYSFNVHLANQPNFFKFEFSVAIAKMWNEWDNHLLKGAWPVQTEHKDEAVRLPVQQQWFLVVQIEICNVVRVHIGSFYLKRKHVQPQREFCHRWKFRRKTTTCNSTWYPQKCKLTRKRNVWYKSFAICCASVRCQTVTRSLRSGTIGLQTFSHKIFLGGRKIRAWWGSQVSLKILSKTCVCLFVQIDLCPQYSVWQRCPLPPGDLHFKRCQSCIKVKNISMFKSFWKHYC